MAGHFFSTRKGREFRDFIRLRDNRTCQMCGVRLMPGRGRPDSAVVDHVRPISLRPDLEADVSNMRAICRACHAVCLSIEAAMGADDDLIAEAKMRSSEDW